MTDNVVGDPGLILIVQDDAAAAGELQTLFARAGYDTRWCASAAVALSSFHENKPDLVVMEVDLIGGSGLEICRDLRRESDVPVILMSAQATTDDIVAGFHSGADDFLGEPFAGEELLVRVQARLRRRRHGVQTRHTVIIDDLEVDIDAQQVHRGDHTLAVTPIEFQLLTTLAQQPGHVFSREELLRQVWGNTHSGDQRLVTVHIQRLRAKIESDPNRPRIVTTVRGIGYRLGHGAEMSWVPAPGDSTVPQALSDAALSRGSFLPSA